MKYPCGSKYFRSFCPQKLSQKYTLGSKTPEKDQSFRIGLFLRMGIWRTDSKGGS
jgi:hypothetical protein